MRTILFPPSPHAPFRLVAAVALAAVLIGDASAEPKYAGWSKVEACREIRELKEKLREGGQLDAAARLFLEQTALPQITLDENRPLIERTRKRIRELLLGDISDDKAFGEISVLIAEFMTALARDDQPEPIVRINAMLLVGELRAKDGTKPWAPAALSLAAAAGDKGLPDEVRIAALVGVAKHVAAGGGDEAITRTFAPPVGAILAEPLAPDRAVAQEWLAARSLQLVPLLVRPAPPKLSNLLAGIAADDSRSIDVRVRAVAALGATADAASGLDAAAAVDTVRGLALAALETEEKAAEARRFDALYRRGIAAPAGRPRGFGGEGMPSAPPEATTIPTQACRRAAWRLYALGTALSSADEKQGLALLMGDAAEPAKQLAKQLTDAAQKLDSDPVEDVLLDALDVLRPPAAGEQAAKRPARQPKPDDPVGDEQKPADPNASPFDNPFR